MNVKFLPLAILLLLSGIRAVNAQTNYSLSFNGTNAHVNYSNSTSYSSTMTIEAWIKTTQNSSYDEIVGWGNTSASTNHAVEFRVANGKLEFGINTNGWQSVASSGYVNTGNWVHVAVVKNGSDITLYINGVQDGSGTINQSPTVNVMEIGGFYYQQEMKPDYYFSGNIDEVRIWNTARTASQITDNLYKELEGGETGLTAYYKMNEGSGSTLNDNKTGGTANGTIYNATYTYGPPALVSYTFSSGTYGAGSWIGYVYQSPNSPPSPSFQPSQYLGSITQTEKFNQDWGSSGPALSGTTYIDNFHIRYRMEKSFAKGKYNITAGGDDGYRLSVDGGATQLINDWSDHGYRTSTASNVVLDANTLLVLDFYENGGGAQISFDYTLVCLYAYIPASLTSTVTGTTTATIGWSANGNDGSVSYSWAVKNLSGSTVSSGSTNSTSASVTGLSVNTTYYFTVVSSNACGSSNVATSSNFSTLPDAPTISSFTPQLGMTGTTITISGTNFTGATAVSFGGPAAASYTVVSATSISATVASGASGSVSVTTAGGTATKDGFVYTNFKTTIADGDWDNSATWSPAGVPAASENVTINHSIQVSNNAHASPAICNNLMINSGNLLTVEAGNALTILGNLSNSEGATLTVASGGSLITSGSISNSGTINIQRTISESNWHFVSSPVTSAKANTFLNDYLQSWSEPAHSWTDITEPDQALIPAQGYGLWATPSKSAASYTFTGTPNTGSQTADLTFTEYSSSAEANEGANLIGNPYPSAIDWSLLDNTYGAVYLWNSATNSYSSWNNSSAVNGGVQYLPPVQGFFIISPSDGTFSINNSHRTHTGAASFFKNFKTGDNSIRVVASSQNYADELLVKFTDEATPDFDLQHDACKFLSGTPGLSELYSYSYDKKLSIDARPRCEVVQLGFANSLSGEYTIKTSQVSGITEAVLEDTKLATFTDLLTKSYTFSYEAGESDKRFKLHFGPLSVDEQKAKEATIYSYQKTAYINLNKLAQADIQIYTMAGQLIHNQNTVGGMVSIPINSPGMYIVRVVSNNKIQTGKIYISR